MTGDRFVISEKVLLAKLIIAQLVKKLSAFLEPEVSFPCSEKSAIGFCSQPDETSPQPQTELHIEPF
jgi:hypothetical protein